MWPIIEFPWYFVFLFGVYLGAPLALGGAFAYLHVSRKAEQRNPEKRRPWRQKIPIALGIASGIYTVSCLVQGLIATPELLGL